MNKKFWLKKCGKSATRVFQVNDRECFGFSYFISTNQN